jgi:hypothetical protein
MSAFRKKTADWCNHTAPGALDNEARAGKKAAGQCGIREGAAA